MRALFFIVASLLAAAPCLPFESIAVRPDVVVQGRAQEDWSRAWWRWAASFEGDTSPLADTTGSLCHLKQNGRVWFLAGTYGSHRVTRTCHVPKGKFLFFPLINYAVMPTHSEGQVCKTAMMKARAITDEPVVLVLEVDGKRVPGLERHRQATEDCFGMAANAPSPGRIVPSAANGYYVMLRPLQPGTHTLNFGGSLPGLSQVVTYTLIVD